MLTPKLSAVRREVLSEHSQNAEILSGWKDVANYLGKGVRTVQRYERELTLPIRRPQGKTFGAVMATKAELNAWLTTRPIRKAFQLRSATPGNATALDELRRHLKELRRLRRESAVLREEHHRAVALIRETALLFARDKTRREN